MRIILNRKTKPCFSYEIRAELVFVNISMQNALSACMQNPLCQLRGDSAQVLLVLPQQLHLFPRSCTDTVHGYLKHTYLSRQKLGALLISYLKGVIYNFFMDEIRYLDA